jgi:hypothetical protein
MNDLCSIAFTLAMPGRIVGGPGTTRKVRLGRSPLWAFNALPANDVRDQAIDHEEIAKEGSGTGQSRAFESETEAKCQVGGPVGREAGKDEGAADVQDAAPSLAYGGQIHVPLLHQGTGLGC